MAQARTGLEGVAPGSPGIASNSASSRPGDVVVATGDGVIVVPRERAEDVAKAAPPFIDNVQRERYIKETGQNPWAKKAPHGSRWLAPFRHRTRRLRRGCRRVPAALCSCPLWFVGKRLHARGAHSVIDEATGQKLTIGGSHTFFFVPKRYWAVVLIALAALPFVLRR